MNIHSDLTIDSSAWDAAIREIERRLPGVSRHEIIGREAKLVAQKLIKHEWRAKGPKINKDLRQRLVVLWDSGNEYNVPKKDVASFRRMPKGSRRMFRERKKTGGKLISVSEVLQYQKRAGYLASGWGAAAQHLGVALPVYASRHNLSKNGSVIDNLTSSEPHIIFINEASPGLGSKHKLEATLRVQARSMNRQMEKSVGELFDRIRPAVKL